MGKIFRYEIRRLILNKLFIGLLIINGIYAWYVLTTDTIVGTAYTAPFSLWSFSAYLASLMPISMLTILFLLSVYFSRKEKYVEILTTVTPMNQIRYTLLRCGAVTICFLIICAVVFGLSIYFYITFFNYKSFIPFFVPALMILLPCYVFTLGIGYMAGRIHPGLLYTIMLVVLAIGFAGITGDFDFFGHGYLSSYPMSLPVGVGGEPAFEVSIGFLIARALYLVMGGVLLTIGVSAYRQKAQKA